MPEFEHCSICDSVTGRVGRSDDSLYLEIPNDDEAGPLCETCYNAFGDAMEACKKVLLGSEKTPTTTTKAEIKPGCRRCKKRAKGCKFNEGNFQCFKAFRPV